MVLSKKSIKCSNSSKKILYFFFNLQKISCSYCKKNKLFSFFQKKININKINIDQVEKKIKKIPGNGACSDSYDHYSTF